MRSAASFSLTMQILILVLFSFLFLFSPLFFQDFNVILVKSKLFSDQRQPFIEFLPNQWLGLATGNGGLPDGSSDQVKLGEGCNAENFQLPGNTLLAWNVTKFGSSKQNQYFGNVIAGAAISRSTLPLENLAIACPGTLYIQLGNAKKFQYQSWNESKISTHNLGSSTVYWKKNLSSLVPVSLIFQAQYSIGGLYLYHIYATSAAFLPLENAKFLSSNEGGQIVKCGTSPKTQTQLTEFKNQQKDCISGDNPTKMINRRSHHTNSDSPNYHCNFFKRMKLSTTDSTSKFSNNQNDHHQESKSIRLVCVVCRCCCFLINQKYHMLVIVSVMRISIHLL